LRVPLVGGFGTAKPGYREPSQEIVNGSSLRQGIAREYFAGSIALRPELGFAHTTLG